MSDYSLPYYLEFINVTTATELDLIDTMTSDPPQTCPPHYRSIQWVEDLSVCISDNFELAASVALPLGGFFSCHSGDLSVLSFVIV